MIDPPVWVTDVFQRLAALENAVSMLNARITVVEDLVRQRDERLDRLREAIDNLATAITR